MSGKLLNSDKELLTQATPARIAGTANQRQGEGRQHGALTLSLECHKLQSQRSILDRNSFVDR
jgi:hypothetical protein